MILLHLNSFPCHGQRCHIVSFHWGPLLILENKVTGEGFWDRLIREPPHTQIGDKNGVIYPYISSVRSPFGFLIFNSIRVLSPWKCGLSFFGLFDFWPKKSPSGPSGRNSMGRVKLPMTCFTRYRFFKIFEISYG